MPRKYAGPLRPGERSARVPRRYTKKLVRAAPKTLANTKKLIKSVIFKTAETKYKTASIGKTELYHNSINNLGMSFSDTWPGQGDGDSNRTGDEIYMQGWKVRLMFGQKSDRPNVTFRCFIVKYQHQLTGDINTYSNFFHNVTGNGLLDPPQYKRYKILKTFKLRSKGTSMEVGEAAKEFTRTKEFFVPMRRKIKFVADASTTAVNINADISLLVLAYDAYGTLITDNIGYVQGAATLYFKDP